MYDKVNVSNEVKREKKRNPAGGRGALRSDSDNVTQIGRKAHVGSLNDHRGPHPHFRYPGVAPLQWVHIGGVQSDSSGVVSWRGPHCSCQGGSLAQKAKLRNGVPQ